MEENPENPSELKQIRTYQGDVVDALQRQKESLYSIQSAEQTARGTASVADVPKKSGRSLVFLLSALLFLVLGGSGGWLAYNEYVRKITVPEQMVPESRFVNAETMREIETGSLSLESLRLAITEERNIGLKHIILKSGLDEITPTTFVEKLGVLAPGSLLRALEEEFMLGSVSEKLFLIFKIKSFENTYAGMLKAEEEIVKSIGIQSVFTDEVFKNKDTRVLRNAVGEMELLYSFLEQEYLIVAEDSATLNTIIERLTREKLTR